MAEGLLLDTCALIWISQDEPLLADAAEAISRARTDTRISLSVMTAWELGMLVSKQKIIVSGGPLSWFNSFVRLVEAKVHDVPPAILIASSFLPPPIHKDPVDRILIATAREHDLTLVTRDRAILAYGAAGNDRTLAC